MTPGWHLGSMLKGMIWQLCPDDVMWIPAGRTNVGSEIWWRTMKEKMDVATGRTWTSCEWICGRQTCSQVRSLFAACMWVYTKCVLCDGQETAQDFLKRRMLSIMESATWVCEEVLEEHEWVSPLTISLKEEEVLRELTGLRIRCSLCGTMGISLVQTGLPQRKNRQVPRGYKLGN